MKDRGHNRGATLKLLQPMASCNNPELKEHFGLPTVPVCFLQYICGPFHSFLLDFLSAYEAARPHSLEMCT